MEWGSRVFKLLFRMKRLHDALNAKCLCRRTKDVIIWHADANTNFAMFAMRTGHLELAHIDDIDRF